MAASGPGTVGKRIEDAAPCAGPPLKKPGLCPSCQVFGSAGNDDAVAGRATEQNSYAGHVRFDDAKAVGGTVHEMRYERAPLSTPKPSSGQFYLQSGRFVGLKSKEQPHSNWGLSEADQGSLRPISGRKFYWRTDSKGTDGGPRPGSRAERRLRHAESQVQEVTVVKAGGQFDTVSFENLCEAALGSLLASVDPRLLWPDDDVASSLGGGKPFGWGAVRADLSDLEIWRGADRYLGRGPAELTVDQAVAAFRDSVKPAAAEERWADDSAWSAIRAALTLGRFGDAEVWYPPGNAQTEDQADKVFEFWAGSSGQEHGGPLGRLPHADALPDEHRHLGVEPQ